MAPGWLPVWPDDDDDADDDDSVDCWVHVTVHWCSGGGPAAAAAAAAAVAAVVAQAIVICFWPYFRCDRWPQLTTEQ